MDLSRVSRVIERDFFGAILTTLLAVVLTRLVMLAVEIHFWLLIALVAIAAWTGAFLAHFAGQSSSDVLDSVRSWTPRLREICLRTMLWLLGAAAVIGVLTVLTASYDILGRVAATMVTTGIAVGFLWPLSVMIDDARSQAAGLLGMASAVVVYSLVLPLIWDLDRQGDKILATSLVIGLLAPAGMAFLRLMHIPKCDAAGRIGVALYGILLVIFLFATWHPAGWRGSNRWWETGMMLSAYGGLSVVCLAGFVPTAMPHWRWLGVLSCLAAWGYGTAGIWNYRTVDNKVLTVITSIAAVVAHTSLAMFVPLARSQQWLRMGTTAAVVLAAVFLDLEIVFTPSSRIGLLGRIAGAAGVVASCGSLGLIVLARLNRGTQPGTMQAEMTHITLVCPRCNKRQRVLIGSAPCTKCGLTIRIALAEADPPLQA